MSWRLRALLLSLFVLLLLVPTTLPSRNAGSDPNASIHENGIDGVILISIDSVGQMLEQNKNENFVLTLNLKRLKDNGVYLGFGLSIYLGILLNRKIYETSWIRGAVPVIVFGALTAAVWIVVIAYLLFENIMLGSIIAF